MFKKIKLLGALSLLFTLSLSALGLAQIVNIAVPADPDSFDPTQTVAAATGEIAFNIYEGLVKATPDGSVEGALASSWTIDESGTIYTFYLRDALFHDGTPVTVDDVITSLNRARDPELAVRAGELAAITDIRALDGAVEITLSQPHGALLYSLAEVFASIYPANAQNLAQKPVGTGPYYLKEWKPNQHLLLEKFPQHWSGEDPYFSQAKFLIIPDENSMVLNLKAGRVDLIPRLEVSVLHQVEGNPRLNVLSFPMNVVQVLAINNNRAPFDDWRVRKALALAVDQEEVILGASWGYGLPLDSALSPAMGEFYHGGLSAISAYDPQEAKNLLKDAGQEGMQLKLVLPSNYPLHVQTGELVAEQWEKIGIKVNLEIVEWGTWLERVYTQRDYEVSIIGLAGRLDPHAILVRYVSDNSRNFFNFNNEHYDELIKLGLETVGEERREIYLQAQEVLAQGIPGVFIMDPPQLVAMNKALAGFRYYPTYVVDVASLHR